MTWKRKTAGGILGLIGFMLSPLSWWNDLVVNIPIAIGVGWLVGTLYRPAFEPAVVISYWLTNVLGFVLMQKGAQQMASAEPRRYSRSDLLRDAGCSLLYTLLIAVLLKMGIIQPLNYR